MYFVSETSELSDHCIGYGHRIVNKMSNCEDFALQTRYMRFIQMLEYAGKGNVIYSNDIYFMPIGG